MPGNTTSKIGNILASCRAQYRQRSHGTGEQRRLRIAGQTQIIIGTIFHHGEQIFAQRIVHFGKNGTRLGKILGKVNPHANGLRPLAGKLKKGLCAHEKVLFVSFLSLWTVRIAHCPLSLGEVLFHTVSARVNAAGFWRNYAPLQSAHPQKAEYLAAACTTMPVGDVCRWVTSIATPPVI
jgi:hypothetical protein